MSDLAQAVGGQKRIVGGPFGSKLTTRDYAAEGVPVIRGSNMEVDGRWIGGEFAYVSEHKAATDLKTNLAFPGDIMVTQRGTLGQVSIIPENIIFPFLVISQSQMAISVDRTKVDRNFVYYFLRSPAFADYSHNQTIQTGVPHINLGILRSAPAEFPNLNQQREIAAILGALDDKIELNRKTAATLEEMARALYRSWFVDFDPVHAKAAGLAPAHMDAATAALFPDGFGADDLPEGWGMVSIYDVARVQYGAPFKSTLFNLEKQGRPLVRIRDLKNQRAGVYTTEWSKKEYLLQPGDTVVGMDGDFTPYTWSAEPSLKNQRVCAFIPHDVLDKSFVRYLVPALLKVEENAAVATTVIHLGKKDIDTFSVVKPADPVKTAFGKSVNPWLDRIVKAHLENQTLTNLRDMLLPRLMSGELRVGEAREQVEEVV
jgi:type I restriction enzyme S subunit